ncbi:MAG: hypothetical protein WCL07_04960 [bacterium]
METLRFDEKQKSEKPKRPDPDKYHNNDKYVIHEKSEAWHKMTSLPNLDETNKKPKKNG